MRLLQSAAIIMATILMACQNAYGDVQSLQVDTGACLWQYCRIVDRDDPEARFNKGASRKPEIELAVIPVVVGFRLIDQVAGNILTDSSKYRLYLSALKLMEKGIRAIEQSGNNDALYLNTIDAGVVPVRYIQAKSYDKGYKYLEADSLYFRTAKEIGRDFGLESEEYIFWTTKCAENLQRKHKNYEGALHVLLPAKDAALHSPEVSDTTVCNYLISLARTYLRIGNHDEAKAMAHEAEKRCGSNIRQIFYISNTLGELYWTEGAHETAYSYFMKAEKSAPSLPEFFAAGINYANVMRQTGFAELAEGTLTGLDIYTNSEELGYDDLFNYYEASGALYTFSNPEKSEINFGKAEEYIDWVGRSELIRHILNSRVYPNEGNSFKIISELEKAEEVYNMFVSGEPRLMNELLILKGYYLIDIHDYKEARKHLEAAYARMLDYAQGDSQMLMVLKYLAQLDEIEGNDTRRVYYLNEQLSSAKVHGESTDLYLDAVADLLHFHIQAGDIDKAHYYLDIYRKNRPEAFDTRCYEYQVMKLEGKTTEAEQALMQLKQDFPEHRDRVNLMLQRYYASLHSPKIADVADDVFADYSQGLICRLLFMSNRERRNMDAELKSRRDGILSAQSFAPSLTELALDYSLFSKGLLFHTQSDIARVLTDNDAAKKEMAVITGLKSELTQAINSLNKELASNIQLKIDSRERYLIDDYLDHDAFNRLFARYNTASLLADIAPEELMIEFVEYQDNSEKHLGCFIIKKAQPVQFIRLGIVDIFDDGQIYKAIWSKIESCISTEKRIYFSTDGILNTMPIEFAEDGNGVPMCEKYDIHRVFHLSDIHQSQGIGNRIEAIGVADHNSRKGEAGGLDDGYRGNWSDLAGVETELYRIAESLDGIIPYHRVFNDDATEAYVKSLSGQPVTTLHISTHGFYLSEDKLIKALNDATDFHHNIAIRLLLGNRTSASGLVMRNGNMSWKRERITEAEDNILTAEEVETLSFPMLSLTVLSACDTGLGDLSTDGVWGLQCAFRIAGSASLICSLRQVKDNGAADFMAEFYRQAATGQSVHDAFYNARKKLLSHDPKNKEVWSSFILIE